MKKLLFYLALIPVLFSGCGTEHGQETGFAHGDTLQTAYARFFDLIQADDYLTAVVYNPWKEGEVYARYYLVRDTASKVPADGVKIQIPVQQFVANSATYFESLNQIGELHTVTGTCNVSYIYNPEINKGVQAGTIQDLGDSYNLNIEKLMKLRPDLVMTTAYNSQDENSKRLAQCGIPVVYNVEWQEATPLGRAEWMRFIAAFYDKLPQADSVFCSIAQRYEALKLRVAGANPDSKPRLLSGQDFRGTWSMPSGESFNATLYRDAGASYFYEDRKGTGSVTTTLEEALLHFNEADIWIGSLANSYQELIEMDSKYKLFKPYKQRNVYNYNRRTTSSGGNDYWEGAIVHADLLLSDLIKLFHPALLPDYSLTYVQKLKE